MACGLKRRIARACALAGLVAGPATAAGLLPNGDFEAGSLIGWEAQGSRDGQVDVVTAGECFSAEDTTRISLFGRHAALLRSGESGRRSSVGILTSDPFVAGDGIVFASLTGTRDGKRVVRPVAFEVRILTEDGAVLTAQPFQTSVVRLREGCPGEPRDGRFYVHYFDTRRFLDQSIRIQFRQNTNTGGIQPFTLIDQVIRFERGEAPLFTSRPQAVAGLSRTRRDVLRLDGSSSFDPDGGPLPLDYRWQIDGEEQVRVGEYPCVADLADGDYTATLFVNDGFHAVSDSLRFSVSGNQPLSVPTTDGNDGDGAGGDGDEADNDDGDSDDDGSTDAIPTVNYAGCDEETTDGSRIDAGTDGGGDDGDGDDGNGGGDVVNQPPSLDLDADDSTVSGSNFTIAVAEASAGVPINDTDLSITDEEGDNILRATIILEDPQPGDALVVDDGLRPAEIDVSADDDSVSFFGISTAERYRLAINSVTLDLAAGTASRTISVSVEDAGGQGNAFATVTISGP